MAGMDWKYSGRKRICLERSKMNCSEAYLGVGAYVNDEWRLVEIGREMEYACCVKSETTKLDRMLPWWCAWTSFLNEEMLCCILRVSQVYASRVFGYDTSTGCRSDSLSIPGWLEISCAASVSGESRSRQQFSCAIHGNSFNIIDSVNIANSFVTVVSGASEIEKHQIFLIKLGGLGAPENSDIVKIFWHHNSTRTIYNENAQLRQILSRKHQALQILTLSPMNLAHLHFIKYRFIQIGLWFSLPDVCFP